MAETERTLAALQALLADNTTQAISAQDLRDLMITALGGYASISVDAGSAAQALTSTPAVLVAFDTAGPAQGAAGSLGPDQITIGVAGVYLVGFSASLSASIATLLDLELFVAAAKQAGFSSRVDAGTSLAAASFGGLVTLAAGVVLDVRGSVAPNASVTIRHAHLSAKRVG